jgi:hypothetical protein
MARERQAKGRHAGQVTLAHAIGPDNTGRGANGIPTICCWPGLFFGITTPQWSFKLPTNCAALFAMNAATLTFCVLSLFVTLGSGMFKISVEQSQPCLAPIDFVLYFNETIPGAPSHEPLIWATGSLSQAPSSFSTALHQSHTGLSAAFHVGGQVYSEGPILAFQPNNTHW